MKEKVIIKSEPFSIKPFAIFLAILVVIAEGILLTNGVADMNEDKNWAMSFYGAQYDAETEKYAREYDNSYERQVENFRKATKGWAGNIDTYEYYCDTYSSWYANGLPEAAQFDTKEEYIAWKLGVNSADEYAEKQLGVTKKEYFASKTDGYTDEDSYALAKIGFTKDEYVKSKTGVSKSEYCEDKWSEHNSFSDFYDAKTAGIVLGGALGLLLIVWLLLNSEKITVTDKRVIASKWFWIFKRTLNLPMHRVTAVAFGGIGRIYIGSSAGKVRFVFIKNNEDINNAICDLLIKQQPTEDADEEAQV